MYPLKHLRWLIPDHPGYFGKVGMRYFHERKVCVTLLQRPLTLGVEINDQHRQALDFSASRSAGQISRQAD